MTNLYTTSIYKNIELDTEQLAITITVLENFINKEKESINFFTDKLNGSNTTKNVRDFTETIAISKNRIKKLYDIIDQMTENELITKHTL